MKHTLATVILILATFSSLLAQTQIELDNDHILIGQQTRLTLVNADEYPSVETIEQDDVVAISQDFDQESRTQTTVITSFTPGQHIIHIGHSDSILLTVDDVADVDTTTADIRDIAPLLRENYTFWEIFRWILVALVGVGVVLGSYQLRKKRPGQPIFAKPTPPPLPPHERALQALEALRRENLWQSGRTKEYHTRLTDIVRTYLEEACNIASTDMTSDETIDAYRHSPTFDTSVAKRLASILHRADMVKFAKSEPLPHEHDRSMDEACEIVNQLADKLSAQTDQQPTNNE